MASNRIAFSQNHGPASRTLPRGLVGGYLSWLSVDVGPWLYVLALLCLVSLLAFAHLGQASHVAQQVGEMEKLEDDVQTLKRDNNSLRLEIAQYEQLERIKQQAQMQGLGKPERTQFVKALLDEPEASRGASEENTRPALEASSAVLPVWLHGALGQFTNWIQMSGLQPGQ
jgi:hypothetical protein